MPIKGRRNVGKANAEVEGKPCICHIKKSGWPWKATGETLGGQPVERCRICGATHVVTT